MFYPKSRLIHWVRCLAIVSFVSHAGAARAQDPLTLTQARQIALAQPLLQSQQAAMRSAQESAIAARALPDPKLRAGIINMPVTGADAFSLDRDSMTMRMIGLMQEFPRAEKRELRGRKAEIEREQRGNELAFTRRAIARDVALAWTECLLSLDTAKLINEILRESERQIEALTVAYRAGKATQSDIFSARIDQELLRDRLSQAQRQEDIARAELSRWIGEAAWRPLEADVSSAAYVPDVQQLLLHLDKHPHLTTLDKQIGMAQVEADLARAVSRPDWSMEVSYGYRSAPNSDMVSLQVGIDLPFLQRNRRWRDVAAKQASVEQVRALKADNLNEMHALVRRYFAEWSHGATRAVRYAKQLLPQARSRSDAALAAYRGGRGDLMSVLDARRMELDLRLQQLTLQAERDKAAHQLQYYSHQ